MYRITLLDGPLGINLKSCFDGKGAYVDSFYRSPQGDRLIAESMGIIKIGDHLMSITSESVFQSNSSEKEKLETNIQTNQSKTEDEIDLENSSMERIQSCLMVNSRPIKLQFQHHYLIDHKISLLEFVSNYHVRLWVKKHLQEHIYLKHKQYQEFSLLYDCLFQLRHLTSQQINLDWQLIYKFCQESFFQDHFNEYTDETKEICLSELEELYNQLISQYINVIYRSFLSSNNSIKMMAFYRQAWELTIFPIDQILFNHPCLCFAFYWHLFRHDKNFLLHSLQSYDKDSKEYLTSFTQLLLECLDSSIISKFYESDLYYLLSKDIDNNDQRFDFWFNNLQISPELLKIKSVQEQEITEENLDWIFLFQVKNTSNELEFEVIESYNLQTDSSDIKNSIILDNNKLSNLMRIFFPQINKFSEADLFLFPQQSLSSVLFEPGINIGSQLCFSGSAYFSLHAKALNHNLSNLKDNTPCTLSSQIEEDHESIESNKEKTFIKSSSIASELSSISSKRAASVKAIANKLIEEVRIWTSPNGLFASNNNNEPETETFISLNNYNIIKNNNIEKEDNIFLKVNSEQIDQSQEDKKPSQTLGLGIIALTTNKYFFASRNILSQIIIETKQTFQQFLESKTEINEIVNNIGGTLHKIQAQPFDLSYYHPILEVCTSKLLILLYLSINLEIPIVIVARKQDKENLSLVSLIFDFLRLIIQPFKAQLSLLFDLDKIKEILEYQQPFPYVIALSQTSFLELKNKIPMQSKLLCDLETNQIEIIKTKVNCSGPSNINCLLEIERSKHYEILWGKIENIVNPCSFAMSDCYFESSDSEKNRSSTENKIENIKQAFQEITTNLLEEVSFSLFVFDKDYYIFDRRLYLQRRLSNEMTTLLPMIFYERIIFSTIFIRYLQTKPSVSSK